MSTTAKSNGRISSLSASPASSSSSSSVPVTTTDKLPAFQVLVLCIINYNEAVQGNIIWPFLPFAVQKWGIESNDIGTYVGILASSFFLAQLLCVAIWGKLADKYGRRPILLIGLLGTALSQTLFGIAKNYNIALLARFLTGALNGNVAIAKVYMGEITTKSTQAAGFAWIAFTWGFGSVTAPAIGGWLADPASQYPDSAIGKIPLLIEYPYFLPAAVSIGVSILSFLLGVCFLPETEAWQKTQGILQQKQQLQLQQRAQPSDRHSKKSVQGKPQTTTPSSTVATDSRIPTVSSSSSTLSANDTALPPIRNPDHLQPKHPRTMKAKSYVIMDKVHTPTQGTVMHARRTIIGEEDYSSAFGENMGNNSNKNINDNTATITNIQASKHKRSSSDLTGKSTIGDDSINNEDTVKEEEEEDFDDDETEGLISGTPSKLKDTTISSKSSSTSSSVSSSSHHTFTAPRLPHDAGFRDIIKDRAIMTAVLNYGVLAFCQILFDELLPVFAKTVPDQGGLGWSSGDVGSLQMMQGATQIIVNLFLFRRLTNRFGLITCFRYAMFPLVPYMILFPALSRFTFSLPLLWVVMMIAVIFKAGFMTTAFTSIMLLINNSSRGVALGAINGVAQSVASFVRAVGPTMGGVLYSASVKADFLGEFRLHIVYTLMGILAFVTYLTSFSMPDWCNEAPDILGTLANDTKNHRSQPPLSSSKGIRTGKKTGNGGSSKVHDENADVVEDDLIIDIENDDDSYDDNATLNEVDTEDEKTTVSDNEDTHRSSVHPPPPSTHVPFPKHKPVQVSTKVSNAPQPSKRQQEPKQENSGDTDDELDEAAGTYRNRRK